MVYGEAGLISGRVGPHGPLGAGISVLTDDVKGVISASPVPEMWPRHQCWLQISYTPWWNIPDIPVSGEIGLTTVAIPWEKKTCCFPTKILDENPSKEGIFTVSIHDDHPLLLNPFFLLLKLPQIKTNRIGVALLCFLAGRNWIVNCVKWESIGEQDSETMGSTVQPPINKKSIATWRFFIRVPSHKFHFLFLLLRCSLEY